MLQKSVLFAFFGFSVVRTESNSSYLDLGDCLGNASVPYCSLGCLDFDNLSLAYNTRVNHTPSAIAIPRDREEVQAAVICASRTGTKVQARSGGHSYAGFSNGGINGSLIIDLKNFQKFSLDNTTNIASVGPGLRLKALSNALWQQGRRAVPHSPVGSIGVGGHFTHGGVGMTSRYWGLSLDYIVEVECVLSDGTFVRASSNENPEIFYSVRGAASEFALVTSLSLRTQPAPDTVLSYSILVSDSLPSAQYAASTLMALQHLAANASLVDRRLSLGVYYMNTTFIITGIYFGGVAEFRSEILPELLRSAPGYQNLTIEETPWVNASASFESLQHDSFFATSVTISEQSPLTYASLVEHFDRYLKTQSSNSCFTSTIILLWGGADSQLSLPAKIDTQYSSFRGYGSLWEIQNMVQSAGMCSDIGEESVKQLTDWRDALLRSQGDHAGAYINHIDPTLDRTTAYRLYYGAERHRRLVALKRRIDPENLFWNPLSITT